MGEVKNGVESVLEGFAAIPRLCDFRPNDFATFRRGSATLTELPISPRGRRLFRFPRLIGAAGSTGAAWALPGFRTDRGGVFGLYNV